jgi:hypothetical protein
MAKFLRILPAQQTTATNGPILLDPDSILVMQAQSGTACRLLVNNIDTTSADIADVTFNSADSTFTAHRNFCNQVCAASSDQKSSVYDMQPIIGGDGVVRTITSIVYS